MSACCALEPAGPSLCGGPRPFPSLAPRCDGVAHQGSASRTSHAPSNPTSTNTNDLTVELGFEPGSTNSNHDQQTSPTRSRRIRTASATCTSTRDHASNLHSTLHASSQDHLLSQLLTLPCHALPTSLPCPARRSVAFLPLYASVSQTFDGKDMARSNTR